jgi:hypothetical protein
VSDNIEIKSEYQRNVDEAHGSLALARELSVDYISAEAMDQSGLVVYYLTEADVYSRLAIAEQQRIANLLTIAADNPYADGGSSFPATARAGARRQALEALGFDPDAWITAP